MENALTQHGEAVMIGEIDRRSAHGAQRNGREDLCKHSGLECRAVRAVFLTGTRPRAEAVAAKLKINGWPKRRGLLYVVV